MIQFVIDSDYPVTLQSNKVSLAGILHVPREAKGIVIFAHGSGSGRLSPRNQQVARSLQAAKCATLLFDLLTKEEETIDATTMSFRFDIPLLAERLLAATHWSQANTLLRSLPIGYFGASTGGGAALLAAAMDPVAKAIVSRGGRPDLAGERALQAVKAATLLIVGGYDAPVIALNQQAYQQMSCVKQLEIVPGASHLFEEPGTLSTVTELASQWFERYLV